MDESTFRNHAYRGAEALLAWMEKKPEEFHKTAHVLSIRQDPTFAFRFILTVDDYVRDGACVYLRNEPLRNIRIDSLKMRKREKLVAISVPPGKVSQFKALSPAVLTVRTDMSFLIKRIQVFYQENELFFEPPFPITPPPCDGIALSNEQASAVETVLSSPVSYVWGAPGTGKTKHVLASCLLRYLVDRKRILLLAPTNNAIENALRAILPVLRDQGIDLSSVYRFGTASYEFQTEFPEVTADTSAAKELEGLNVQMRRIQEQLSFLNAIDGESFKKTYARLNDLKEELDEAYARVRAADLEVLRCLQKLSDREKAEKEAYDAYHSYQDLCNAEAPPFSLSERIFHPILTHQKRSLRHAQRIQYHAAMERSRQAAEAAVVVTAEARAELSSAHREQERLNHLCSTLRTSISDLFGTLHIPCANHASLGEMQHAFQSLDEMLSSMETLPQQIIALQAELAPLEKRIEELSQSDVSLQKESALLLAGTLDSSLNYLKESTQNRFSHIMIDEAAYLPIAKGMTCFAPGCPVAFFGDHYQLPPVCEMPDVEIRKHKDVALWALPVTLYSELLSKTFCGFSSIYFDSKYQPDFSGLAYAPLHCSYRFDNRLASLLDKMIYHPRDCNDPDTIPFFGVSPNSLKITVLNAPRYKDSTDRVSKSEADVIYQYLKQHPLASGSTAVLTPYRKQRELLWNACRPYEIDVCTVHRAQGLEWDRVIFSVVDTDKPFFTNSFIPEGRKCLNTAISRVRKELVIVCDIAHWRAHSDQLLSHILRLSP